MSVISKICSKVETGAWESPGTWWYAILYVCMIC